MLHIGMSLLGLDYALLISSVVALGALIPILGAYIGAAVGVIVLLLVHPIDALIFTEFPAVPAARLKATSSSSPGGGALSSACSVWTTMFAVLFWGGVRWSIPGILIGTPPPRCYHRLLRTSYTHPPAGAGHRPQRSQAAGRASPREAREPGQQGSGGCVRCRLPSPQGGRSEIQRLSLCGEVCQKISSPCSEIFTEVTDEVSLTRILPLQSENGAFHSSVTA
ncbi:MAG: AI-2E family transporter [Oscillospiraceae bacterium]